MSGLGSEVNGSAEPPSRGKCTTRVERNTWQTSHKVHKRLTITCDDYLEDPEAPPGGGVPPPNVFGFIGFAPSVKAGSSLRCSYKEFVHFVSC